MVFLRRKWRVFRLWGPFWGVLGDFGAQTRHFFSFFGVTSPLREGVGVLEITPHLLNVTVQAEPRFGGDSLQPLVRRIDPLSFK